jgi:tetratricopeptide (TPR) repeat protein
MPTRLHPDQQKATLDRASLRQADLREVDFRGASLVLADLREADLRGCRLAGADLSGANLAGARLDGVDLSGARRDGTWFADTGEDASWLEARRRIVPLLDGAAEVDPDDALAELDEVGVIAPHWGWPWVAVALAFRRAGRSEVAFDLLLSASTLHPDPLTRRWLGRQHLEQQDWESAVSILIRARADLPNHGGLLADLGYALGRLGRLSEAKEVLQRAIGVGRDDANTWGALGLVLHQLRENQEAVSALRRAARSDSVEHRLNLARVLEAQGDLGAAWSSLEGALEPALVEERSRLASDMGGEEGAWMTGGPGVPPEEPVEVPLPVSPSDLDALRREHPALGARILHVVFAPPWAVGVVVPAADGARLAWNHQGRWTVSATPVVGLPDAERAEEAFEAYAAPADVPVAFPLFDGRTCGAELAFWLPSGLPESLRQRLRSFDRVLERDFDIDEGDVAGSMAVLDGLSPAWFLDGAESSCLIPPPGAYRRGSLRWALAQRAAWTLLDRDRAILAGSVSLRPGARWPGENAAEQRRISGLACVVWARHHLALAGMWPARRAALLGRGLDAVAQAEAGLWPMESQDEPR